MTHEFVGWNLFHPKRMAGWNKFHPTTNDSLVVRGLHCLVPLLLLALTPFTAEAQPAPPPPPTATAPSPASPKRLGQAAPEIVGMNAHQLDFIQDVVTRGIEARQMPGCVVLVARRGKIVFLKAYGDKRVAPDRAAMTTDTVFDLASLTKPIATATSVMLLIERGKLRLQDRVAEHIPEFAQHGKGSITVSQLLTHETGLIPDNALADFLDGPQKSVERLLALTPTVPPGSKFIYSDVGFMVLGELIRRVSEKNVHEFSREHIFTPLGMSETGYLPDEALKQRAAPTEQREGRWMQGEVHDPRAYHLGGIAGHAGLFSTAEDLAVYAQMLLDGGVQGSTRIMSPRTIALMTQPRSTSSGWRALGWDVQTGYSSNRGELLSDRAFGHGGFTGTVIWIDPRLELIYIFLSNRVHPDGKGLVNTLAGRIATVVAAAIEDTPTVSESILNERAAPVRPADNKPDTPFNPVLTGIDVLQRGKFAQLAELRIGLITNHTGVNGQGISTARLLHEAAGAKLVALFSPEHGSQGKLDVAKIDDSRDPETGLPVFSLYGASRKPTPESLKDIDALVFDIQDVGTRFYTYVSTMGNAMQAAAEHKKRFIVLDRPNPISGVEVAGPVLDAGKESFVGFHRLPVRHGMTVGELAQMFNAELKLGLDLQIIKMEGWSREAFFDSTGLLWINPSPNMRSLTEALLYPGMGLLETTNVSVGRGTDTPFEVLGAPWIEATRLAAELNRADLAGVKFVPVSFTPNASKFKDERCGGVNVIIVNRKTFEPVRTGLEIARQLRRLYPSQWEIESFGRLLGNAAALDAVRSGKTLSELEAAFQPELKRFLERRKPFLLYR